MLLDNAQVFVSRHIPAAGEGNIEQAMTEITAPATPNFVPWKKRSRFTGCNPLSLQSKVSMTTFKIAVIAGDGVGRSFAGKL